MRSGSSARCACDHPTAGGSFFKLPMGYRPSGIRLFEPHSGSGSEAIAVYPSGDVISSTLAGVFLSLDQVSFRAE